MKYRTSLQRQKLCGNYCKHAESGLSDESFPECSMEEFNEYSKRFPTDFPADRVEEARRRRLRFWEECGIEGKINASVWVFNMKNRFGWRDRQETKTEQRFENVEVTIVK